MAATEAASFQGRVSVITPTYNRDYALHRVFESLEQQTLKQTGSGPLFEWIVIDDGSGDGTRALIQEYARKADFPIVYHYQENRGKAAALNVGFAMARGELVLMADSDDRFVPETMETFLNYWDGDLRQRHGDSIVSIICQVRDGDTDKIISNPPQTAPVVSEPNYLEYLYRRGNFGEGWSIGRTDVMRRFPFPELPGVKFIPEAYVWNDIARQTKSLIIQEVLRVAYFEKDGYTKNPVLSLIKQPIGARMHYLKDLNDNWKLLLRYDRIQYIKNHLQLVRMSSHAGRTFKQTLEEIRHPVNRFVFFCLYALGWGIATLDCRRYGAELSEAKTAARTAEKTGEQA